MTRSGSLAAASLVCLCAVASGSSLASQNVIATVTGDPDGEPVQGALVSLETVARQRIARTLTDLRGRAALVDVAPGSYRLRVEMIGRATYASPSFEVTSAGYALDVRLSTVAIELDGMQVEAERGSCSIRAEDGVALSRIWDEARKALTATSFTTTEAVHRYQIEVFEYETDVNGRRQGRESRTRNATFATTPYRSRPAEELLERGFMQRDGDEYAYFAPDAAVLLSDAFLDTHCLRSESPREEREGLLGVGFQPVGSRRRIPDISGTFWIDRESYELELLDFRYVNLPWEVSGLDAGGEVRFRRLGDGTWIVPEWSLRKPILAQGFDARGSRLTRLIGYGVNGAVVLEVTEADGGKLLQAELGSIDGMVLDGEGEPLAGARVGLVGSNQSIFSDREGRFRIDGLAEGVYRVRFDHDGVIGRRPDPIAVELAAGSVASTLLRVPSLEETAKEGCTAEDVSLTEDAGALLGRVISGGQTRNPVPGARVNLVWEFARMSGVGSQAARITGVRREGITVVADRDGRFLACGVPVNHLFTATLIVDGQQVLVEDLRIPLGRRAIDHMFLVGSGR